MALPVAAIIAIVFGVWALLVLIIFALYQFFKSRGNCSCECAPCGKESEGGCSQCCISLSEACDCDCCKPNSGSCLDTVCPKKKVSCVDIILCQCCAEPGDQHCCIKCESSGEPCSKCCEQPSKCFGGPACTFRPCDCGEVDEDSSWSCSDLCCCECNYKAPTLHPHPTQSHQAQAQAETHAQARTPPRQLMEQISMLNHDGYMLQIVGPDGKVSVIDTHAGSSGPSSAVPTVKSTPVIAFQPSPIGSPQGHPSSPRLGDTGSDRFTRDHYERMLYDHRMVSNYGRKLSITEAQSPMRVLPPIPGSPGTSRGSSLFTNHSERQIRTVHPS